MLAAVRAPDEGSVALARTSEPAARPRRLQRSRAKGARTPDGVVYCGRPTIFGNPFRADRFGQARSVKLHRAWLYGELPHPLLLKLGFTEVETEALRRLRRRLIEALPTLAGCDLQCWCALTTRWCHVETLLPIVNSPVALRRLRRRAETMQ